MALGWGVSGECPWILQLGTNTCRAGWPQQPTDSTTREAGLHNRWVVWAIGKGPQKSSGRCAAAAAPLLSGPQPG